MNAEETKKTKRVSFDLDLEVHKVFMQLAKIDQRSLANYIVKTLTDIAIQCPLYEGDKSTIDMSNLVQVRPLFLPSEPTQTMGVSTEPQITTTTIEPQVNIPVGDENSLRMGVTLNATEKPKVKVGGLVTKKQL